MLINIYRKKPVLVEVIQFLCDNADEIVEWTNGAAVMGGSYDLGWKTGAKYMLINTLEGCMKASYGDYIIKGINGEFYPCKPNIFHKTYDIVE